MQKIIFSAAFEQLRKDREGEVKITFTVPLSDEQIARTVPIQTALKVAIFYEDTSGSIDQTQDSGLSDL
jgi:hypothetical protein